MKPEELFSDHFRNILKANDSQIALNIFLLGYKCDQGVRACGGRSGSEQGPNSFREVMNIEGSKQDSPLIDLSEQLKQKKINIYDLGNISKYQLSKYKSKSRRQSINKMPTSPDKEPPLEKSLTRDYSDKSLKIQGSANAYNFDQIYRYIFNCIPKSRIVVVGGSDDVCKSVYDSCVKEMDPELMMMDAEHFSSEGLFDTIIHFES
eukprot:CAMPEP_0170483080 /NCGR_PEP_ID=MMETSP0208-20121228/2819_1 /TAXON_ID=197538 /ORGANISM="Strombidium inclinatum, Strain S3" /LENGTH=205 /DNA_ID=CAMNT_0010755991 /DNA_START=185 /DNA_END=802 /DNA_ORIENTATION=-